MKKFVFNLLLIAICIGINAQSPSLTWKKRVDADGTPPPKARQYVYEDKMIAWLSGNKWDDEIVSIKEIWYTSDKPGDSHWFARIQTKKAVTPFYVEYDPANQTFRSVIFWIVSDLLPANYKKYIDDANAKYLADEEANKIAESERVKAESIQRENEIILQAEKTIKQKAKIDSLLKLSELPKIKDTNGNEYRVVQIGEQTWMIENLQTANYNNGDPIEQPDPYSRGAESIPGRDGKKWVKYIKEGWGYLYTWYAVVDNRGICPIGYHVPSSNEVNILIKNFPNADDLKSVNDWNNQSNNKSMFSALPGGFLESGKKWWGDNASFWLSDDIPDQPKSPNSSGTPSSYAHALMLSMGSNVIQSAGQTKGDALSVRCIKD